MAKTPGVSRREILVGSAGFAAAAAAQPSMPSIAAPMAPVPPVPSEVALRINGRDYRLALDPRTTLLDALRERIGLTGSKKGCDQGQCGACTLLIDGRRALSCLTLAVGVQGKPITTIEGLAGADGALHPMQQAFIDQDAFQCGYCTPGQIMSAVGCVREGHADTDPDIREYMSGNLCRCAAYPNIVAAIKQAKAQMRSA
jgi:xanthine dehydrogenase YagT iron-sulfur-binding subunit